MSQLGSSSNDNILIRKRIQTGEQASTTEIQLTTHSRQQASSNTFPIQAFQPIRHMY